GIIRDTGGKSPRSPNPRCCGALSSVPDDSNAGSKGTCRSAMRWLHLHVSGGNGRVAGGEAAGRRAELAAGGVVARGRECDAAGADVLRVDLALDDERNVQGAQLAVVVLGGVDRAGGPRGEVEGGVGAGDDEFLARPPGGIEAAGRGLAADH